MFQSFISTQFLKFLFAGGIAACVNFGSRFIYNQWMGFSAAVVLAYITGMITAFILAKYFVFRQSQMPLQYSVLRFLLINLLAVAQTLVVSLALLFYVLRWLDITMMAKEIAHAIGIIVPLFSSFIGHKYWSFSENKPCL